MQKSDPITFQNLRKNSNVNQSGPGDLLMFILESSSNKAKFIDHVGVASWFSRLTNAQSDFVSGERVVWVDIEGVPLHAWSRPTFCKIGSKWGEVMELEENNNDYFARKRLCELFVWSSSFKEVHEAVYCSYDDSVKGDDVQNVVTSKQDNLEVDSDGEAVPDSFFGEQVDELENEIVSDQPIKEKEASSDPFNLYGILNNCNKNAEKTGPGTSIPFPPGFTPQNASINKDDLEVHITDHELSNGKSAGCNSRILEEAEKLEEQFSSVNQDNEVKIKEGGSILMILDEMIKVGRNMGYSMEGCSKDMEKIIDSQGVHDAFR
ncbi:hypothetical protein Tco_0512331 [Tanacetum coccineum]